MPEGRASLTFASFFFWNMKNFAAKGAENQRSKLVGGLCGRAILSGLSRADLGRLSLPEAGIPTMENLFPFSVEHRVRTCSSKCAPPSFQHASSPTTLTRKSRSAAAMKGSTWLPANASSKRQTQSRSRKRPSDGWAGKAMNFYSHSDGG